MAAEFKKEKEVMRAEHGLEPGEVKNIYIKLNGHELAASDGYQYNSKGNGDKIVIQGGHTLVSQ